MVDIELCRSLLGQVEKKQSPGLKKNFGLVCREMPYGDDSAVMYVAKDSWTNRFDPERDRTRGIFFSSWVSHELMKKGVFAYNIHAMKLRELPGYKLQGRRFAEEFRARVADDISDWPNVSIDHGPLTLLQGDDTFSEDTFADQVTARIDAFTTIHHHLDELLEEAKV